jgi:hypothetical protein
MVGIMIFLFRMHLKNKQVYYSSPFNEADLVFEKIKTTNPKLFESLAQAENVDEMLKKKSIMLSRVISPMDETNFKADEVYEAAIKIINELLLVILVFKKIKEDRAAELGKIRFGLRMFKSTLDEVKVYTLERLSKSAKSRTFYLQKTILNYSEDLDDFIKKLN